MVSITVADLPIISTVLLVDDEDLVRKLTSEFLSISGYKVLEAQHGAEALSICESMQEPIHLLLTDVAMPHISGPKLANLLKERWSDILILYMSGYTKESIAALGLLPQGSEFIQKPFTLDDLLSQVRELLD